MGKALGKQVIKIAGRGIKEVGKEAGKAALRSAIDQIHKPSFPLLGSSVFLQDVQIKTADAANKALKEIPHHLSKAQTKEIINATSKAATIQSYMALKEKTAITTKEAAEEISAGATSDAITKHVFKAEILKEQMEEKANLKADMGSEDIEGVRFKHREKENKIHHEVIDLMKEFLSTNETFKEDILFNIKEGKTNPKFDICTNGLYKIETQITELQTWIQSNKYTSIHPESATLHDELEKLEPFLEPLIAGMGNLQRLAKTRQQKHTREFTDEQLNSLKLCLAKVNTSFEILTGYMLGMRSVSGDDIETKNISEKGVLPLAKYF